MADVKTLTSAEVRDQMQRTRMNLRHRAYIYANATTEHKDDAGAQLEHAALAFALAAGLFGMRTEPETAR